MSQSAERALQIRETINHGTNTRVHSKREVLVNSIFAFTSTIVATLVLLSPFTYLGMTHAVILTFVIGTTMAFLLGGYIGKASQENILKTGTKYAALAILGAVISHYIADLVGPMV